ncbi:MAG: galactose oxidase early set domain-containing protein [Planctomycetota bacterium]
MGEQQFRHLRCCEAPAYTPELFKGGAWHSMAANAVIRDYHSTAVLLPSGKVLTGGGESRNYGPWPDCTNQTGRVPTVAVADYQVFLPPYLNCGASQPTILGQNTTLPNNFWVWPYGSPQNVTHSTLPLGVSIAKVTLMRVGSVTHHADINQRCVELPFTVPATPPSTVRVAVPTKASYLLPRGFYMLFLVTSQGMPSKAAFVQIQ